MSDVPPENDDDVGNPSPERLKELVKIVGGAVAAARLAGAARSTLDQWLAGKSRVPFAAMSRLAQAGDKSLDWLAGIDPHDHRGAIFVTSNQSPEGFVTVPTLQVSAAAGRGRITAPDDLEDNGLVAFRETWLRSMGLSPGRVHIVWAVGDSMSPTIRDGDMLLVDRSIEHVQEAGIYIVVVAGAVVVKRLQTRLNGSVVLKSDNERYDDEVIPRDEVPSLIVEGRVRWVGGPI